MWDGVPQLGVGHMESAVDVHRGGPVDPPQVGVTLQCSETGAHSVGTCSHTHPTAARPSMLEGRVVQLLLLHLP